MPEPEESFIDDVVGFSLVAVLAIVTLATGWAIWTG